MSDEARLLLGDCRVALPTLDDKSVQTCICSPPYWGLRSYGTEPLVWSAAGASADGHVWAEPERAPWANDVPGPSENVGKNPVSHFRPKEAGQYCTGAHDWREIVKPATNGIVHSAMQGNTTNPHSGTRRPQVSEGCGRCSAWRGHLGMEPVPDCLGWARGEMCNACFVCHLRLIFGLVKRVLRDDGTLWVVIGDSFSGSGRGPTGHNGIGDHDATQGFRSAGKLPLTLPEKNLVGTPWRLALALQADGWIWRQEIVWAKRACMPESTKDRCTRSHEAVLMFAKGGRYFYDATAIAEPTVSEHGSGNGYKRDARLSFIDGNGPRGSARPYEITPTRNKRDVWTLGPSTSGVKHYATYPVDLVAPMILASTRVGDTVLDPFSGVATTAVAARSLGRGAVGIELNPQYHAWGMQRLDATTPALPLAAAEPAPQPTQLGWEDAE